MVVECGFNMAASNSLSTVQRQGRSSSSGSAVQKGNNNHAVVLLPLSESVHEDDMRSNGNNCEDHQQFRAEFLSASRRKRVNRSAKLKQCKLDARREQWLSQGSQGKQGKAEHQQQSDVQQHWNCEHHYKAESGECMVQERAGPTGHSRCQGSGSSGSMSERTPVGSPANAYYRFSGSGMNHEVKYPKKEAPARRQVVSSRAPRYFRDEEELHGESVRQQDLGTNGRSCSDMSKPRSNSSCASSSYTGSGSEDNDESHDAEDDWESAFDALHVQSSPRRSEGSHKGLSAPHSDAREPHDRKQNGAHHHNHHYHHHNHHYHHQQHYHHHPDIQIAQLKPEYRYRNSGFGGRRGNGGRAWRPDDVSRPPTLPRLRVQHGYSNHSSNNNHQGWGNNNMWGNQQPASPSYCPICTEELDMTDSSYLPCSCGFQLCLFCYHRISSDDGRCPGCRKAYNTDLAVKVSRSSSVWLRV